MSHHLSVGCQNKLVTSSQLSCPCRHYPLVHANVQYWQGCPPWPRHFHRLQPYEIFSTWAVTLNLGLSNPHFPFQKKSDLPAGQQVSQSPISSYRHFPHTTPGTHYKFSEKSMPGDMREARDLLGQIPVNDNKGEQDQVGRDFRLRGSSGT